VRAAAELGRANLRGASRGSTDLVFEPGEVAPGNYRFDIGTAGSTGLVLHTVYLPLALRAAGPCEISLIGGTHVSTSPSFHFLDATWRAYLAQAGLRIGLRMARPGFYPRGGGVVTAIIQPCPRLTGLRLPERSRVCVRGFSAVAGLDAKIAQRQARRATYRLQREGLDVHLDESTWPGGPGTVVHLELDTQPAPTSFFALGARGKPAEAVADEAADQVLAYLRADPALVDAHSGDQLLLPLALAEGPSEYSVAEVTQHILTNIAIIQRFVDRSIVCEGAEGQPGRVRID
jgi:RNA 3'-terminal phosphate cyclase (ATP)